MIYGMDNIFKENVTNLNNLISYLKTPQQIIESFKERLNYMGAGLKRNLQNNVQMILKRFFSFN
jgi:hypothetical protein